MFHKRISTSYLHLIYKYLPCLLSTHPSTVTTKPKTNNKNLKEGFFFSSLSFQYNTQIKYYRCSPRSLDSIRVLIGFNLSPMLSGERSSGAIQDGLRGLLGLPLNWLGLYSPYPMRKYSIGINIACGCSSVTIDPHSCTCKLQSQQPHTFRQQHHSLYINSPFTPSTSTQDPMYMPTNTSPF